MRQLLVQVKERIPPENQREVVYEVPCKDCELHWRDQVHTHTNTLIHSWHTGMAHILKYAMSFALQ